jgi:hypothetical protein
LNISDLSVEHTLNRYTFELSLQGASNYHRKQPDNRIVAYYADDRDDRITIDTTQAPFDKIFIF